MSQTFPALPVTVLRQLRMPVSVLREERRPGEFSLRLLERPRHMERALDRRRVQRAQARSRAAA